MRKAFTGILTLALALGAVSGGNIAANAAPGDSIALYFSAPFVQGSHLSGPGVYTETFSGMSAGACASSSVVGTITGTCTVELAGSTQTPPDALPKIPATLTNFVTNSNGTTYTFTDPVKYVGLWWFSGNSGNTISFYDASNTLIATLNSADIITFLGTNGYGALTNSDTGTLTRADGQTVLRKQYYRFPGEYTGTVSAPVTNYNIDTYKNEPWAYLNLFVSGGISVKKITLSGTGFEHDNLTVSENESSPLGSMVLVKSVLGTTPSTQNISWAPTNSTADISSGVLTPNSLATVTSPVSGGGAVSYSVESAGTSACTVNSSTGALTATAAGTCVIRATAAAVNGTPSYYAASTSSTFTFTANVASTPTPTPTPTPTTAPASTTPAATLATTGANSEWLIFAGLLAAIAGSGFLAFSRRKRIW